MFLLIPPQIVVKASFPFGLPGDMNQSGTVFVDGQMHSLGFGCPQTLKKLGRNISAFAVDIFWGKKPAAFYKFGSRPAEVSNSLAHSSFLIIVSSHAQLRVTPVASHG